MIGGCSLTRHRHNWTTSSAPKHLLHCCTSNTHCTSCCCSQPTLSGFPMDSSKAASWYAPHSCWADSSKSLWPAVGGHAMHGGWPGSRWAAAGYGRACTPECPPAQLVGLCTRAQGASSPLNCPSQPPAQHAHAGMGRIGGIERRYVHAPSWSGLKDPGRYTRFLRGASTTTCSAPPTSARSTQPFVCVPTWATHEGALWTAQRTELNISRCLMSSSGSIKGCSAGDRMDDVQVPFLKCRTAELTEMRTYTHTHPLTCNKQHIAAHLLPRELHASYFSSQQLFDGVADRVVRHAVAIALRTIMPRVGHMLQQYGGHAFSSPHRRRQWHAPVWRNCGSAKRLAIDASSTAHRAAAHKSGFGAPASPPACCEVQGGRPHWPRHHCSTFCCCPLGRRAEVGGEAAGPCGLPPAPPQASAHGVRGRPLAVGPGALLAIGQQVPAF